MSIKADDISFRYAEKGPAVMDGFSAVFAEGKITAVTGRNGSGKTTLSRLIMGILKPESGAISIDGEAVSEMSLAETGRRIGYVMQNPARQIFSTSVFEEMDYGLKNMGLAEDERSSRINEYLEYFDLADRKEDFPFYLSHGEKQRLVLAAVLAMRPSWVMLDEPTAALDYERRDRLGEYLQKVNSDKKCSVIIISHDSRFVERYADASIRMEGGRRV